MFSPFEADRNRKIQSEAAAPAAAAAAASSTPRSLTPLETASRAVETPRVKVPSAAVPEPAAETTSGALALAPEHASVPETAANLDFDRIRDAVTAALDAGGHNTAAVLLANGKWREKSGGIEVEVALRKTMLGLTMNAEAEKICRDALRSIGVSQKITFVSGEGSGQAENSSRPKSAPSGSIQAAALDHPLVKQAQELFQAEVRSVLDLREKK